MVPFPMSLSRGEGGSLVHLTQPTSLGRSVDNPDVKAQSLRHQKVPCQHIRATTPILPRQGINWRKDVLLWGLGIPRLHDDSLMLDENRTPEGYSPSRLPHDQHDQEPASAHLTILLHPWLGWSWVCSHNLARSIAPLSPIWEITITSNVQFFLIDFFFVVGTSEHLEYHIIKLLKISGHLTKKRLS